MIWAVFIRRIFAMPRVDPLRFFKHQTSLSRTKAEIVAKFVDAWANALLGFQQRRGFVQDVAYVDLFCGPGQYLDGSESTPLLVLRKLGTRARTRDCVRTFFSDETVRFTEHLQQHVSSLDPDVQMKHTPFIQAAQASTELISSLNLSRDTPQCFFLDQFGYADVPPTMITEIFRARMCDCIFFFKTSRVLAALTNPKARGLMENIFGAERAAALASLRRSNRTLQEIEDEVLEALRLAMKSAGATMFQQFPFRSRSGLKAKHHLIYLGKHPRGLEIAKDIMARESSFHEDGVPIMGFEPGARQPGLFDSSPIDDLSLALQERFAGRTISVAEIYTTHNPGTRYILPNYQEALRRLEEQGVVTTNPSQPERKVLRNKITMPKSTLITFPDRTEK
jgi:three-Cys-motif partner protein